MVRSVAGNLPEQVKNNQSVNTAAGNGGQKMSQYSWFTVYLGHPAVHTFIQNLGPMLCTDLMCDFIHGDNSFKKLVVFWSYYLMDREN